MIKPAEAVRGFNRQDIVRLLDHAYLSVFPMRIPAVQTQLAVTDVVALLADSELILNVEYGLRKLRGVVARGGSRLILPLREEKKGYAGTFDVALQV